MTRTDGLPGASVLSLPRSPEYWPRPSVESYEDADGGGRVVLHQFRQGRDGEVVSYQRRLPPGTGKGRPHRHMAFEQRWTVAGGRLRYRIGREEAILEADQELVIEPGVAHLDPYNPFDEPAVVTNTVSPASAFASVWARTLGQALRDGILDDQQEFRLPHLMLLLSHEGAETFAPGVPVPLQRRLVIPLLAAVARRRGYSTAMW
jgi:mannose-6-phosphate isomerase-like protein (cupin superfamily)